MLYYEENNAKSLNYFLKAASFNDASALYFLGKKRKKERKKERK